MYHNTFNQINTKVNSNWSQQLAQFHIVEIKKKTKKTVSQKKQPLLAPELWDKTVDLNCETQDCRLEWAETK